MNPSPYRIILINKLIINNVNTPHLSLSLSPNIPATNSVKRLLDFSHIFAGVKSPSPLPTYSQKWQIKKKRMFKDDSKEQKGDNLCYCKNVQSL